MVWGSGFRFKILRLRGWATGFRVQGLEAGLRVEGLNLDQAGLEARSMVEGLDLDQVGDRHVRVPNRLNLVSSFGIWMAIVIIPTIIITIMTNIIIMNVCDL